jgi:hypothetical protein
LELIELFSDEGVWNVILGRSLNELYPAINTQDGSALFVSTMPCTFICWDDLLAFAALSINDFELKVARAFTWSVWLKTIVTFTCTKSNASGRWGVCSAFSQAGATGIVSVAVAVEQILGDRLKASIAFHRFAIVDVGCEVDKMSPGAVACWDASGSSCRLGLQTFCGLPNGVTSVAHTRLL